MRWLIVEKCSASYSSFQTKPLLFSASFPTCHSASLVLQLHFRISLPPSVVPALCSPYVLKFSLANSCRGSLELVIWELEGRAGESGQRAGIYFSRQMCLDYFCWLAAPVIPLSKNVQMFFLSVEAHAFVFTTVFFSNLVRPYTVTVIVLIILLLNHICETLSI